MAASNVTWRDACDGPRAAWRAQLVALLSAERVFVGVTERFDRACFFYGYLLVVKTPNLYTTRHLGSFDESIVLLAHALNAALDGYLLVVKSPNHGMTRHLYRFDESIVLLAHAFNYSDARYCVRNAVDGAPRAAQIAPATRAAIEARNTIDADLYAAALEAHAARAACFERGAATASAAAAAVASAPASASAAASATPLLDEAVRSFEDQLSAFQARGRTRQF